jgi:hypothetical protein
MAVAHSAEDAQHTNEGGQKLEYGMNLPRPMGPLIFGLPVFAPTCAWFDANRQHSVRQIPIFTTLSAYIIQKPIRRLSAKDRAAAIASSATSYNECEPPHQVTRKSMLPMRCTRNTRTERLPCAMPSCRKSSDHGICQMSRRHCPDEIHPSSRRARCTINGVRSAGGACRRW